MFSKEAQFICRRCTHRFYFSPDQFNAITTVKKIACPKCGSDSKRAGDVERFFKFYPRFIVACELLANTGFTLINYSFTVDEFGLFLVDSLEFHCRSCGSTSKYTEARIYKFADQPGLFACKKCKVQATPLKTAKEFFISYRAVSRASFKMHDFLWDILAPLQLDPADYPVQWRIYRGAEQ